MTINYNALLSDEQKRNILNQRISQFAAEAWQHELNKRTCEEINDENGVSSALTALATLESAINVHQQELDAIDAESSEE